MENKKSNIQRQLAVYHLARLLAGASDVNLDAIRAIWPDAPLEGDLPIARKAVQTWLQGHPNLLAQVLNADPEKPPRVDSADASLVPPLPERARLTPVQKAQAASAGRWLDEYVDFASAASPLTPHPFHVVAGLMAGMLAIARRLCLRVSTATNTIYPNLYLLFVGQSTRPRKTTALRVLRGLLKEANMDHFLLADRQTPEAFTLDLTTRIPDSYGAWPEREQEMWLKERAIAAQRGWLLEEASHLLDSFNRDYSSGLLPIVLDLYDSSDRGATRNTISRGRESVERPYLCIFGATTYAAMSGHIGETAHWHNGLFARFALVGSDDSGTWEFWSPPMEYPGDLVARLHFIAYSLFPMPDAWIETVERTDGDGKPQEIRVVKVEPELVSSEVIIEPSAREQWERYSRAVSYDMIPEEPGEVLPQFYASYGRLGTTLIKAAMILATFDADSLPVRVEAAHVYRAQTIVETWRANLHTILRKVDEVNADVLTERIKAALARSGRDWTSRRDLLRKLGKRWSKLEPVISDLEASGEIEHQRSGGKRGPASEKYRLLVEG